jgi:flagellar protein FliJ
VQRFEFSLEQLLRLKRQRERLAELRQKQTAAALAAARAEVAALWERVAQAATEFSAAKESTVALWMAASRHVGRLREDLAAAEAQAERADKDCQEATALRKDLAVEVEALLTLREGQWQEYRRERGRQEQLLLDDWGLRFWGKGRKSAEAARRAVPGEVET